MAIVPIPRVGDSIGSIFPKSSLNVLPAEGDIAATSEVLRTDNPQMRDNILLQAGVGVFVNTLR